MTWTEYGRQTIAMPATIYFGVAMNAHDNGLSATGTIELQTTRLQPWYFPSRTDCTTCHNNNAGGGFLGPNTRQFNKEHFYAATGVTDNQLRAFNHVGMFDTTLNEANIPGYDKLAHVDQTSETLEKRARSYVDTNCANCHRPGGVPALWDARYDTPLASQNIIYGIVNNTLGLTNPRVIVPQETDRSMMHYRINRVGANQMPPVARNLVDAAGVQLIADWIASLTPNTAPIVTLTAPANGANFITPNPIEMTATASDADGITRVEFYDGATLLGATTAPFTYTFNNAAVGTHTLFARAFDGVNNSTDSASVTVTVTELIGLVRTKINFQPAASAVPADYIADTGATYAARNGLTYGWSRNNTADSRDREANADQRYDTFNHMQKDHGGGDVTSTWSIALPNSTYSVHVVTGEASFTDGVQTVSANGVVLTTGLPTGQNFYEGTANVMVTNGVLTLAPGPGAVNSKICYVDISEVVPGGGNQLPLVELSGTTPEFAAAGGSMKVFASASDPDGSVERVEFYADGVKFGEDFTAPYSYVWTGMPAGTYSITARAIDNAGSGAMSDRVERGEWRGGLQRAARHRERRAVRRDRKRERRELHRHRCGEWHDLLLRRHRSERRRESAASNQSSATPVSPPISEAEMRPPVVSMTPSDIVLSVSTTVLSHTYQLQYSDTLAANDWHDLGAPVSGDGQPVDFLIARDAAVTRRFYRIVVSQ